MNEPIQRRGFFGRIAAAAAALLVPGCATVKINGPVTQTIPWAYLDPVKRPGDIVIYDKLFADWKREEADRVAVYYMGDNYEFVPREEFERVVAQELLGDR